LANSDNDIDNDDAKKDAIAVALHYEAESEYAPKVVAGGRGSIAEQILEIAFANNIKVRKDQDLVELLSSIDIDSEIPVEAFAAVAEILIYVYRANGGEINIPGTATQEIETGDPAS
jgi:flagellar biosynthesis protein